MAEHLRDTSSILSYVVDIAAKHEDFDTEIKNEALEYSLGNFSQNKDHIFEREIYFQVTCYNKTSGILCLSIYFTK